MVKSETVKNWRLTLVQRVIEDTVKDFSSGAQDQINLGSHSARKDLSERIVSNLMTSGFLTRVTLEERHQILDE